MKKKILSLLLTATLTIGLLPTGALAADGAGGGSPPQTQQTAVPVVVTIAEQAQWENFVATVNADNTYQVTLSVDVTAANPVPTFKGTLDGGGHKIAYTAAAPATSPAGTQAAAPARYLFTAIAAGSTIKNLNVVSAGISSAGTGVTIENCTCEGAMPTGATIVTPPAPTTDGTAAPPATGAEAPAQGTETPAPAPSQGDNAAAGDTAQGGSTGGSSAGDNAQGGSNAGSGSQTPDDAQGGSNAGSGSQTPDDAQGGSNAGNGSQTPDDAAQGGSTGGSAAGSGSQTTGGSADDNAQKNPDGDNSANSSDPLNPTMFMFQGTSGGPKTCNAGESVKVIVGSMTGNAVTVCRSDNDEAVASAILDKGRALVEIKTGAGTPLTGGSYTLTAQVDGKAIPGTLTLTVKGSSVVTEPSQPSTVAPSTPAAGSDPSTGSAGSNGTASAPNTAPSTGPAVTPPASPAPSDGSANDPIKNMGSALDAANSAINNVTSGSSDSLSNVGNVLDGVNSVLNTPSAEEPTTIEENNTNSVGGANAGARGNSVTLDTSLGNGNRCPYGTEIKLTANVQDDSGNAVTSGTVTVYCGNEEVGKSTSFADGSATVTIKTEQKALLPNENNTQKILDIYYKGTGSTRSVEGTKIGSLTLAVVLESTPAAATAVRSNGQVTVTPPSGYKICQDIYSSSYTASDADWKTSLSYSDSTKTEASYYLRNSNGIVLTKRTATITEQSSNSDEDNLTNISDPDRIRVFQPLEYTGEAQDPEIYDIKKGRKLTLNLEYTLAYENTGSETTDEYRTSVSDSKSVTIYGIGEHGYNGVVTLPYSIKPANVTVSIDNSSTVEKVYDSLTTVDSSKTAVTFTLDGVFDKDKDKVTVKATSYAFDNANVNSDGEKKVVTASDLYLEGDAASNYNLLTKEVSAAIGKITPLKLEVAEVTADDKVYDGTTEAKISDVKFKDGQTLLPSAYTATGTFSQSDVGEDIAVTVTVTPVDSNNLTIEPASGLAVKANITPATPTNIPWPTTLEGLVFGTTLKDSQYSFNLGLEADGVNDEKVAGKFDWAKPETVIQVKDTAYEVTFTPTGTPSNYVSVTKSIPAVVSAAESVIDTLPSASAIKYGQKLKDVELTGGKVITANGGNGTPLDGKWEFDLVAGDVEPTKVGEVYAYSVRFVPENSNYATVSSGTKKINVTVEKATPAITIYLDNKNTDNEAARTIQAGSTYRVRAERANPYDATLKDVPEVTLEYWIKSDSVTSAFRPVTNNEIAIPQEADEGATLVIRARTDENESYNKGEKTVDISVTHREVLTVKTSRKDATYDGKGHDGLSTVTFTDKDGKEVKLNRGKNGYTVTWEDAGGNPLEEAPVNAGAYKAIVNVDTAKYFLVSAPVEFSIARKPLEWSTSSLTAAKREGNTGEAPVSGKPSLTGYVTGEKNKYKFADDLDLVTSGFASKTEFGEYTDVYAVPAEEGKTWAQILGNPPANYTWPQTKDEDGKTVFTNPTVIASVLRGVPGHEDLCLKFGGLSSTVPENLTMYADIEALKSAMRKGLSSGMRGKNMRYYDVQLVVVKEDGTMEPATAENFPSGGIEITLPFPTGTDSTYTFEVVHMFATGDLNVLGTTETFKEGSSSKPLTKDEDGLHFTITALSPLLVAWSTSAKDSTATDGGSNSGNIGSTRPSSRPNTSVSAKEDEYRVRVSSSTGGSVSADSRYAEPDETVELTIKPRSGYTLSSLTVTDDNDNKVRVRRQGNKYVFTMPDSRVDVEAVFASTTVSGSPILSPSLTLGANCIYGTACPSQRYQDLNTSMWYHTSTDYVISHNLMTGLPDGRFAPYSTLSRAMIVYILYTHSGRPTGNGSAGFRDIDRGAWYEEAVNWAVSMGIVQGIGNNLFAPNAAVTREEIAQMLYNYAVRKGINITATQAQVTYTDSTRIGAWALPAVTAMQQAGVVTGKSDNMFEPRTATTRVETAQMLMNLFG